ncbi:MAG: lipoprotein-releasing ABC transporter permease subunit, partial [Vibrionaceae bacterium]
FRPLPVCVGFRYLRGRTGDKFGRFVSYLSTAGITVGVMALVTVLSVMNGFESELKERILGVLPHAFISEAALSDPLFLTQPKLRGAIVNHAPLLLTDVVVQSANGISGGKLLGIDPSAHEPIASRIMDGQFGELNTASYRVVIGKQMARDLALDVGDKVRLLVTSASHYSPLGKIPLQRNFTVAAIYATDTDLDGEFIYANIHDVARLTRKSVADAPTRLFLADPFDVAQLQTVFEKQGFSWFDWRTFRGELFQAVKMEKNIMGLMLGLIIVVAAFNIICALIMVVMEKQAEVAILKTLGMYRRSVVLLFLVQGASSGLIGALLGGAAGVILSLSLNDIFQFFDLSLFGDGVILPIVVESSQVLLVVLGAMLVTLCATFLPSLAAASTAPAKALRYE